MSYDVVEEMAVAEHMAAVRREVAPGRVGQAWRPALDIVWSFLRARPQIARGHNLFLYHHPLCRGAAMTVEFGVQVAETFEPEGDILCVEVPPGRVARTVHIGPYERLGAAHDAIRAWCAANGRAIGSASWEIYGDWDADPARLETTIKYLLG